MYASTRSCRNEISNPRRASFTDYSKATRVRKFDPAWTGVMDTNILPSVVVDVISGTTMFYWLADMFVSLIQVYSSWAVNM